MVRGARPSTGSGGDLGRVIWIQSFSALRSEAAGFQPAGM